MSISVPVCSRVPNLDSRWHCERRLCSEITWVSLWTPPASPKKKKKKKLRQKNLELKKKKVKTKVPNAAVPSLSTGGFLQQWVSPHRLPCSRNKHDYSLLQKQFWSLCDCWDLKLGCGSSTVCQASPQVTGGPGLNLQTFLVLFEASGAFLMQLSH